MKRPLAIPIFILIASLAATALFAVRPSNFGAKAQDDTPQATASPTPVDQKWKIEYGEIESLELKLREANKLNREIYIDNIKISADGKRFVFLWCESGSDEEDEGR